MKKTWEELELEDSMQGQIYRVMNAVSYWLVFLPALAVITAWFKVKDMAKGRQ